jgi:hypothetical protein
VSAGGLDPAPPDPGAAPLDVAAIRVRADAATPGPWSNEYGSVVKWSADESIEMEWLPNGRDPNRGANTAFIAHARADVPALCDALERERKVSTAWKERSRGLIASAQASDAGDASASYDADRRVVAAEAALRALGIDPEAP